MRSLVFLALSFMSPLAFAGGFSLNWSETPQQPTRFLEIVQQTLPSKMREAIAEPYTVSFSANGFTPVAWGKCDDLTTYARENLYRIKNSTITLNQDLAAVLTEDASAYRPSCLQDIDYNLALGAVYQAVAEIFDRTPSGITRRKSFSRQTNYVHTILGGTHIKQKKNFRDLYLDDEPRLAAGLSQAFTAEFENFQVNPEFYCAHPGMWTYLNSVLETNRSVPKCSKAFTSQLYDQRANGDVNVTLDPAHVYRVDFAYAHPGGKSLMGKLGHAMLRVVACSPAHPVPGPECLADIDYHYFLSFNSEDVGVVTGFLGKGTAQLFIVDYHQKLKEYTDEGRQVDAIPLTLTPVELATLLGTAWDWHRRYRGRWNNITNNCVTEVLDLLRASSPRLDAASFPYVTPGRLAHILQFRPLLSEGQRLHLTEGHAETPPPSL